MEDHQSHPHRKSDITSGFEKICSATLGRLTAATSALLLTGVISCAHASEILVPLNAEWKYYDSSEKPAISWMSPTFDAKDWKSGDAPFGVDFSEAATVISSDGETTPTTYFRTTFEAENPSAWSRLDFFVRANDAFILFLDGHAIFASGVERKESHDPGGIWHHPGTSFRHGVMVLNEGATILPGQHSLSAVVFQNPQDRHRMMFDLQVVALPKNATAEDVITRESVWQYHDGAEPPSAEWKSIDFDASDWKSGKPILGYGDPDIKTTLDFGPDEDNRPITAWLRTDFDLSGNERTPDGMQIQFLRDDGVVVYLNGIEMVRHNMPGGTIEPSTLALDTQNNAYERIYHLFPFDGRYLRPGRNTVAVEVHQAKPDSSDLRFDMRLGIAFEPRTWNWKSAALQPPPQINQKRGAAAAGAASGAPSVVNVGNSEAIRSADSADWRATATAMRKSAEQVYQAGKLEEAARRYAAGRWATEFAGDARVLAPELKQYLLSTDATALSLEFFDLLSPRDKTKKVYAILNNIYSSSAETFGTYPGLAFAISIVYDQKPPRGWPHHQVSQSLLPRTLPDPVDAFNFWTSTDQRGKTLHSLDKLQLEELKYVVDVPVSIEKLEAALSERARLTGMSDLYSGINYDHERFRNGVYNWPHASYELNEIKKLGGICVDQAYFTTTVAKAHGVPSMLVSGAGQDGNHAWVGFLGKKSWDFNTGRYPESKFVTGTMFDPQTWKQPTDHEIAFLSERFRGSSKYRMSRIHGRFAREFFADKNIAAAEKAARASIASESRNVAAWTTLLSCLDARKASVSERETALTNAAKSFSRYADMETQFLEQLAASYSEQGKAKEAEKLRTRIIRRNTEDRPDLALVQAKSKLDDLIKTAPVKEQVAHYKKVVNRLNEAGLIAYYALTNPFLRHLSAKGETAAALDVLKHTKRRLKSADEGPLGEGLAEWETQLSK